METELLLHLRAEHGRVSTERLVSGPGLHPKRKATLL
ncbi:glucokinase [Geobacter sp.]|nr:glucokinase [Geobacter sp.]